MKSKFQKIKRYSIAGSLILHVNKFIVATLARCRRKLDFVIGLCVRKLIYRKGSVQNNKIFVMTFDNSYSCNPKYIVEEILHQNLPIEIVWVVPPKGKIKAETFPSGIKLVRYGSYTMYEEMATAKIWIDNALNCVWHSMPKKKEQIYINTWHGSMGIKKLSGNKVWLRRAKRCNKITDYCISNSQFEEDVYHGTFWKDIPCLKYGHARNDVLFDTNKRELLKEKVCAFFEVENGTKIFLYAPTFRDNGGEDWLNVDFEKLKISLEKRFGGEWIILVRMHFKNRKRGKVVYEDNTWLKNASAYADMQELLAVIDAGMTDYSSWAYDYILTKQPMFIYAPDLAAYDQRRGFYYPLETTPFPIAHNNEELADAICQFDNDDYLSKVNSFLTEKGCYEDGKASVRVVNLVKELVGTTQ